MTRHAGVILQARLASARLPFKAVAPIAGQPLLAHCIARLQDGGHRVILATTDRPEDDALASMALAHGTDVFRGDATDVLARFVAAAETFDLDVVVRATGDNPAVDTGGPSRVIAALAPGVDYAIEEGLPYGTCVEAVTRAALTRAARCCRRPEDREHVTVGIRSAPDAFRAVYVPAPAHLRRPDLRFTVDTRADLLYMRDVFRVAGEAMPPLERLIAAADTFERREAA
ncbi:MAG: acylneuraminate cytidylyltransferase [Vicinamibacterales bacterium]